MHRGKSGRYTGVYWRRLTRFQPDGALLMYLAIKAFLKRLWRPPGVSLREDPGISGLRIPSVAPQLDSLDVVPMADHPGRGASC